MSGLLLLLRIYDELIFDKLINLLLLLIDLSGLLRYDLVHLKHILVTQILLYAFGAKVFRRTIFRLRLGVQFNIEIPLESFLDDKPQDKVNDDQAEDIEATHVCHFLYPKLSMHKDQVLQIISLDNHSPYQIRKELMA